MSVREGKWAGRVRRVTEARGQWVGSRPAARGPRACGKLRFALNVGEKSRDGAVVVSWYLQCWTQCLAHGGPSGNVWGIKMGTSVRIIRE